MLHPTDYAVAQGAYVNIFDNTEGDDFKRVDAGYNIYDDNSSCNWWLRTLGGPSIIIDGVNHNYYSPVKAMAVAPDGGVSGIHNEGYDMTLNEIVVRPAMWIDCDAPLLDTIEDNNSINSSDSSNPNDINNDEPIPIGEFNVGDSVWFGSYEQDGNIENGPESIEWTVLDKLDNGYTYDALGKSICDSRTLLCIAADTPLPESPQCPVFDLNDTDRILDCILKRLDGQV